MICFSLAVCIIVYYFNPIESWEEMKDKFKEKYLPEFYRNHLSDKLHTLRQGNMPVRDYIARFHDITLCCDVRENCYQIISRFCLGLRSDIRRAMLTSSYHVDFVEEAFHLALELELSLQRVFIFKDR